MIFKCSCCGRFIYPHDFEIDEVCPFCGCEDLIRTDEDEQ